jgi:hypothetical protein
VIAQLRAHGEPFPSLSFLVGHKHSTAIWGRPSVLRDFSVFVSPSSQATALAVRRIRSHHGPAADAKATDQTEDRVGFPCAVGGVGGGGGVGAGCGVGAGGAVADAHGDQVLDRTGVDVGGDDGMSIASQATRRAASASSQAPPSPVLTDAAARRAAHRAR